MNILFRTLHYASIIFLCIFICYMELRFQQLHNQDVTPQKSIEDGKADTGFFKKAYDIIVCDIV
ncbi:MAG: hypothetical protein DIZ77_02915 [endosymbiont of Seepiophila jonesi]|uniref:Uncharacterized protein n=1 Tax=endosymbiont of Lamellibrachia luymesi TaxID=2200907 RepID=A0A370DYQ7_9GAMM|nr:MAG: hypothetical protein DIZ79_07500 [endosymbiont of Lamellibrachia luymesi]RDH94081.1 MAG: hypothetical protein DIZ77_02915 [endosymbiont of Seepiophila jonesi]